MCGTVGITVELDLADSPPVHATAGDDTSVHLSVSNKPPRWRTDFFESVEGMDATADFQRSFSCHRA
ncbi:hypothetical protein CA951_01380 [Rhodococcus sp. NCIMB 12038]|nr:hypothetical protein CA951_01380 [Rhodococcus sp. NCIMB 12038]